MNPNFIMNYELNVFFIVGFSCDPNNELPVSRTDYGTDEIDSSSYAGLDGKWCILLLC